MKKILLLIALSFTAIPASKDQYIDKTLSYLEQIIKSDDLTNEQMQKAMEYWHDMAVLQTKIESRHMIKCAQKLAILDREINNTIAKIERKIGNGQ